MHEGIRNCILCGTTMSFEEPDKKKGLLFACMRCQDAFCQSCFISVHGEEAFEDMFDEAEEDINCPRCFVK
jgi:hypothetical protein